MSSVFAMASTKMNYKSQDFSKETDTFDSNNGKVLSEIPKMIGTDYTFKHKMIWKNAIGFLIIHILALWGFILLLTGNCQWKTVLWAYIVMIVGLEGITIGAHRHFTHRSFKATPLLRVILVLAQTIAGQNSVLTWSRDHRTHHRYSDTDADPHNAKRGFFFSHIGWLMCKKHPYVIQMGTKIDLSDLKADWMVTFQHKYYYILYLLFAFFIPVYIPVAYFGEGWWNSLLLCYFTRYALSLNITWLVNSVAHLYGTRPYDKKIQPVESWFVALTSLGEGWHNYHHAFPWDYKVAELSMHFNITADIIRFFEKIGLAYDLKTASTETVIGRITRAGDGSHYKFGNDEARAAVTAWGPLHPLNPTYNTTFTAPQVVLKTQGPTLDHITRPQA